MSRPTFVASFLLSAALASTAPAGIALAQSQDAAGKTLAIELNKSADGGGGAAGCRLTFVARNETQAALDKASYEVAVFDANKQVAKLLVLDFGGLTAGKTKVVEFLYPELGCKDISRILVNSSHDCQIAGSASPVCMNDLKTTSLSSITFDQ